MKKKVFLVTGIIAVLGAISAVVVGIVRARTF